ncbi:MAG: PAS domain S-box protein [bacterium]
MIDHHKAPPPIPSNDPRVLALIQRMVDTEDELRALLGTEIDLVIDPATGTPIFFRETQHALQVAHVELETQNEELRTTEEQLIGARDRYLDLYDFAPVGYFTVDDNWKIEGANLTGARLLGAERQNLLQQPLTHFIAPASQDDFHFFRIKSPQKTATLELQLTKEDGTTFWAHFDISVMHGKTGYRLAVSDISRRMQAEAALLASEQSLREMNATLEQQVAERTAELQQTNIALRDEMAIRIEADKQISFQAQVLKKVAQAVIATDMSMNVLYWNPAAEQLYGWSSAEAVGRNAFELISPQASEAQGLAIMKALRQGESWRGEYLVQDRHGHIFPVDAADSPFFTEDGRLIGIIGVSSDITARKQAEAAVAAAHRQLQSIIDNTSSIVYAFDLEERFVMANSTLAALFNTTPAQMIGKRRHAFMPTEDADWHEANDRQAIEVGTAVEFEEYSQFTDRAITWLTTKFPLRDAQGEIYAVAGISADISERKRAEEALRKQHQWTQDVLASIQDGFLTINYDWTITYINQRAAGNGGFTPDDLIGKNLWEEFPYLQGKPIEACYRQVMTARIPQILETESTIKQQWYEIRVYPTEEGISIYWIDITERKQAEAALQTSEATLSGILDAAQESIWLFAPDGRILLANSTALRRFGKTAEEVIGKYFQEFVSAELAVSRLACLQQVVESRQPADFEDERAGICFSHSFYPVFGADGQVKAIAGFSRDITARKLAEEALQASEERYHTLFDGMTEGFALHELVMDEQGNPVDYRFLDINPAFERLTGLKREDVVGNTHKEVLPGDDPIWLEVYSRVALTGEPLQMDNYSPALQRHYEVLSYRPAPLQFAVIFMDVTERKQAEEALTAAYEEIAITYRYAPVGLCVLDTDLRYVRVNERMAEINGLSVEQHLGRTIREVVPDIAQQVELDFQHIIVTGEPKLNIEICGETAAHIGVMRTWVEHWLPLRNSDGVVIGINIVADEITERKRTEEALRTSLREKDVLLKEIHHRVKNNMQVISSLVNLQAETLDNPGLSALFNDLRDQIRSMALVHEKLYQSDSLARVDFAEYAESLLNYLWRAHGDTTAKVQLKLNLQSVPLSVETAVPCGLILNELVTNALKHAYADCAQCELTVTLQTNPEGRILLRVSDNGPGLPEGLDWRKSTSLGLRLVQMLTTQLRGTLDVTSDDGVTVEVGFRG